MDRELLTLLDRQGGVATSAQLLAHLTRREFEKAVRTGVFDRLWQGIYCLGEATDELRLRGLDLATGVPVAVCLGTAAARYGFDTENTVALRSRTCTRTDLWRAALAQAGRRGIVDIRNLIPIADGRAESPMESEARLVMFDGGLPLPEAQYEIVDGNGELRRFDFAWPDLRVAAEYEGVDWHGGPDDLRRDRRRLAAVQDVGWTVVPVLSEDVRRYPVQLVARIERQLRRAQAA